MIFFCTDWMRAGLRLGRFKPVVDPTLRSADIEAGIERGLRIHAALAQLTDGRNAPSLNHLSPDERIAIERFLATPQVAELLFRPGKVLTEQHLSDTRSVGIVDHWREP